MESGLFFRWYNYGVRFIGVSKDEPTNSREN